MKTALRALLIACSLTLGVISNSNAAENQTLTILPVSEATTSRKAGAMALVRWQASGVEPGSLLTIGWRKKFSPDYYPPESLLLPLTDAPGGAWVKLPPAPGDYEAFGIIHGTQFNGDFRWLGAMVERLANDEKLRKQVRDAAAGGQSRYFVLAGLMDEREIDVFAEKSEAQGWFEKAIANGKNDSFALLIMGRSLATDDASEDDKKKGVKLFLKASALGNVEAMMALAASAYSQPGIGESENYIETYSWIRKAADAGDPGAMGVMGLAYKEGYGGIPEDAVEAVKWYRKAGELGDDYALNALGDCYDKGIGVPEDVVEAIKWYRRASDLGNSEAMRNIAICHQFGRGLPKDMTAAAQWMRKAADSGDAGAMLVLGLYHKNGAGVPKDETMALKWLLKSANLGNVAAMNEIGLFILQGIGVPQELGSAVEWYRKAADLGDSNAMMNLGVSYLEGDGVPKDVAEAVKWYRKAGGLSDTNAMVHLGACYEEGDGVVKDIAEALKWYRKASDLGNHEAMLRLGWCYVTEIGMDQAQGVGWLRKSADLGNTDAMWTLGQLYEIGSGVAKNETEALKWYRKGAAGGDEESRRAIDRIVPLVPLPVK